MINTYICRIICELGYNLVKVENPIKDTYGKSIGLDYYKVIDKDGKIITHGTASVIDAYFRMIRH